MIMPELPDVEVFKRYFNRTALHKQVEGVEINNGKVLEGVSARKFKNTVMNCVFDSSLRHGKHFFVNCDNGKSLSFHFGMTGSFEYFKNAKELKHARIVFELDNGYRLAFVCPRMFGKAGVVNDTESFIKSKDLGPDAMELSQRQFFDVLQDRRGTVKSVLMNQSVMAGIGNIYSDEILFQSRIHPASDMKKFGDGQIKNLYENMQKVVKRAIEVKADPSKLGSEYLLSERKEGSECPGQCGGKIRKSQIASRSSYYCPSCQEKL
jgi:formamidopyrimidine-DNA glycosylase